VLLLWLCRNRRVRRAWVGKYATGQSTLGDLGKFARERFVNEPEILDAWVNGRVTRVRHALDALELYGQRRIYVPLPVRVGTARMVERPDAAMLRQTFTRPRAVVCVVGGGGSGKSTLACALARWAMSDDPSERLAPQRMVPVFIVNDTNDLLDTVTRALREMLGDEELPDDLMRGLLAQQRLLVVVDALSEREPETQRHVEDMFASAAVYNAVVIISRTEPRLGAVERTMLYPLLLDQKRVVPFIVDYVAQLADAEPLQGGRTLLQLGDRILELAETGGHATPVTPLLVTMFVDSAMSRAQAGLGLEGLPQDVPEIFVDYLKRVYVNPSIEARGTAEDEFIRAARVVARVSLGGRLVPGDFSPDQAKAALETAGLSPHATALLEALISGGVIERRTFGGIAVLRFGLDPVAEYLAAIQSVSDLRQLGRAAVATHINALMEIEGYPRACDGYLKAFATCYRAYRGAFGLPEMAFSWEVQEESPTNTVGGPAVVKPMDYELVNVRTESDWRDYHSLRRAVLWEARGRSGYDEHHADEYLSANHPLLLKLDGRSIGTTRLDDLGDGRGVVRLVAIAADSHRRGHGRVLSRMVEDYARGLGLSTLLVNATPDAVGYYDKMGWHACVWDEAELKGVASDCKQMVKSLLQNS
jgi:N-acetylglutamate synthase-like GNAT family acetyltransferase